MKSSTRHIPTRLAHRLGHLAGIALVAAELATPRTTFAADTWPVAAEAGIRAPAPTEHAGLSVRTLGVVPARSMAATLGLQGHRMQLRAITIEPGGQIAMHGHDTRPGLVHVVEGEWIEGRAEGETVYAAGGATLVEDEATTHWFYNRGTGPATALVCDIVPEPEG